MREDVFKLPQGKVDQLTDALKKIIEDGRFQKLAAFHNAAPCPHHDLGGPKFLSWHRLYSWELEKLLGFPLPYWDFTQNAEVPQLWREIMVTLPQPDSAGGSDCSTNSKYVSNMQGNIDIDARSNRKQMHEAYMTDNFETFMDQLDSPHTQMHGVMGCHMAKGQIWPPYDPVFWLIHAGVDRQFAIWQVARRKKKTG